MIGTKEYEEGRAAYNAGKQRKDNPYLLASGSKTRLAWLMGFNDEESADMAA